MKTQSKKNILCFGANSFLAKAFFEKYNSFFDFIKVYHNAGGGLFLDFELEDELPQFIEQVDKKIDGIVFFQGIAPAKGMNEITSADFIKMLKINLIIPALLIKELHKKINTGSSVVFFSSIAKTKGSYDPSYGSAKAGIKGLIQSLANAYPNIRFNAISPGLIEGSPVHKNMSEGFIKRHTERMFQNDLVKKEDVISVVYELLLNKSINRTDIEVNGGYI